MQDAPFDVRLELDGWELFWARLELVPGAEEAAGNLRERVAQRVRERWNLEQLASQPTVAALRRLFRAAGCDPTRYRPSSEALLRRVLKDDAIPSIHPLVDLNNGLSAQLAVPCCVMAEGTFFPPLTLRAGRVGEVLESLRGPFRLEGKPLLADRQGPFGTPITDSRRVLVQPDTAFAWLVAYLPRSVVSAGAVEMTLRELMEEARVAEIHSAASVA